jgi:hypothetical protein
MTMTEEQLNNVKIFVNDIKDRTKISSITVSRVVKTQNGGSVFVSMTGNYGDGSGEETLSMREAKIASLVLGKEVHTEALSQAGAGSVISNIEMQDALQDIKNKFNILIVKASDK